MRENKGLPNACFKKKLPSISTASVFEQKQRRRLSHLVMWTLTPCCCLLLFLWDIWSRSWRFQFLWFYLSFLQIFFKSIYFLDKTFFRAKIKVSLIVDKQSFNNGSNSSSISSESIDRLVVLIALYSFYFVVVARTLLISSYFCCPLSLK